jgi:heme/copper-type cytochrome/quinol oxidase subunit 3
MFPNSYVNNNLNLMRHPFHVVKPSVLPLLTSFAIMSLMLALVAYFHFYKVAFCWILNSLFALALVLGAWWYEVVMERTYEGKHTKAVQQGLRIGMVIFILSEVSFFASFFWAFFHSRLSPAIQIGGVWPPRYLETLSPWGLPLFNTLLLLTSGRTVTWAHYDLIYGVRVENMSRKAKTSYIYNSPAYKFFSYILTSFFYEGSLLGRFFGLTNANLFQRGDKFIVPLIAYYYSINQTTVALFLTVFCGSFFLCVQYLEYLEAPFSIADSVYGSLFFLLTGFHGFHVLVGTLFLLVCFIRHYFRHFRRNQHIGFEAAIWYWHFVDVVWLCLFCIVYWWGGA